MRSQPGDPARLRLLLPAILLAALAQGCGQNVDPTNPCDPGAPASLRGKGVLTGTVVLEQRSDPLGAEVLLRGTSFQASVAGDGSFRLEADPGTYSVVAVAPGYVTESFGVVTVESCKSLLVGQATLRLALGQVRGQLDLQPVVQGRAADPAGTMVSLTGTPQYLSGGPSPAPPGLAPRDATAPTSVTFVVLADASGGFNLIGIPVGVYVLSATLYGYAPPAPQPIDVGDGTTTVQNALSLLLNSGVITGGASAPGAADNGGIRVDLAGISFDGHPYADSRLTTSNGSYTFNPVPAGTYTLSFYRAGFDPRTGGIVPLAPGQVTSAPAASLSPSLGSVSGAATLPGGTGSGGIVVSLSGASSLGGLVNLSAITLGDGSYSIGAVPVGSAYTLTASDPGFLSQSVAGVVVLADANTVVPSMSLPVHPGTVTGVASLSMGSCLPATSAPGVSVGLSGTTFLGNLFTANTSTASNGGFSFAGVPAGTYSIIASEANFAPAATSDVVVSPGGEVSAGTLVLLDAVPPSTPLITTSSAVTNATAYVVMAQPATDANLSGYQKLGGAYSNWTPAATSEAAALSFNFSLHLNQNNTLQIRAVDCAGNAGPADFVNITEDNTPPAPPTNVQVVNRNGRVDVTWTASSSSDTQGYLLYYGPVSSANPSDYNGSFAIQGASPLDVGNATAFTLSGVQNLTPFFVALRAYDRVPNQSTLTSAVEGDPAAVPLNLVGTVPVRSGEQFHSVALVTDYAYVTISGTSGTGFRVYNIGVPTAPSVAGSFAVTSGAGMYGLAVSYPYAFATSTYGSQTELDILNVRVPSAITRVGAVFLGNPNSWPSSERNPVSVQWPFAYLGIQGSVGLAVYFVGNPSAPALAATLNPGGDTTTREVVANGRYAYTVGTGVHVVDISNPAAPYQVGLAGGSTYTAVSFSYPYLFAANNSSLLDVYGIDPVSAPTILASIPDALNADRLLSVGPLLFLTSGSGPLQVFDMSNPSAPSLVGRANVAGSRMALKGSLLAEINPTVGLNLFALAPPPPVPVVEGSFGGSTYVYQLDWWQRYGVVQTGQMLDVSSNLSAPTQAFAYSVGNSRSLFADSSTAYLYFVAVKPSGGVVSAALTLQEVSNPATTPSATLTLPGCAEVQTGPVYCDCGGYGIDVQGGFAYVATGWNGVAVVDVSNPLSPRPVASVNTADCALGTAAYGERLVVADRTSVQLFNIANPAAPVSLAAYPVSPSVGFVVASGGRVYATGRSQFYDGNNHALTGYNTTLTVLDATSLGLLGSLDLSLYGGKEINQAQVSWPYAYLGDQGGGKIWVLDVTNPAAMKVTGRLDSMGARSVSLNGPYLLTGGFSLFGTVELE